MIARAMNNAPVIPTTTLIPPSNRCITGPAVGSKLMSSALVATERNAPKAPIETAPSVSTTSRSNVFEIQFDPSSSPPPMISDGTATLLTPLRNHCLAFSVPLAFRYPSASSRIAFALSPLLSPKIRAMASPRRRSKASLCDGADNCVRERVSRRPIRFATSS